MTFSDIGKSLSNYNRCLTMKNEGKLSNNCFEYIKHNKNLNDQGTCNTSTTRQILYPEKLDSLNKLSNNSIKPNLFSNNNNKYPSIDFKKEYLTNENSGIKLNSLINLFDSQNSSLKNQNNHKNAKSKMFKKDSEITINSMSISSSNNNLTNLIFNNQKGKNNMSIFDNNSLEMNNENKLPKKDEISSYDNYFKDINSTNNVFDQISKERIKIERNKSTIQVSNKINNVGTNNNSNLNTEFDSVLQNSRKLKIDQKERVQNKLNILNNLKTEISSVSDRNYIFNLKNNKNVEQLAENNLITSMSSLGAMNTIDNNQINNNNYFSAANSNNNRNNTQFGNLDFNNNQNPKRVRIEKDSSDFKKEYKLNKNEESAYKNFKYLNNHLNNNLNNANSQYKASQANNTTNSNNFRNLNDLLNNNQNTNSNNNLNKKNYDYFSAEKSKLLHFNSESLTKNGKTYIPSFDYMSNIRNLKNKNTKSSLKENSMNPALKKINELKSELSNYTNSNSNKKPLNNPNSNTNQHNFINPSNIDLGNLITNTGNAPLTNSNFNFNFNFYNGPNINTHQSLNNVSYNYMANLHNQGHSNSNHSDNNLGLLMKLLENKNTPNSNNINNLKLGNSKNSGNENKYKYLNLNYLTNNEIISNNSNDFAYKNHKNKNLVEPNLKNKNSFNNLLDFPITAKNKNINYFHFDDHNKPRTKK